jgi:hypothetical protein
MRRRIHCHMRRRIHFYSNFPSNPVKPVRSIAGKKHFCSTFEHQFHALVNLPSIQDPVI